MIIFCEDLTNDHMNLEWSFEFENNNKINKNKIVLNMQDLLG